MANWPEGKRWLMGILSALIVAAITRQCMNPGGGPTQHDPQVVSTPVSVAISAPEWKTPPGAVASLPEFQTGTGWCYLGKWDTKGGWDNIYLNLADWSKNAPKAATVPVRLGLDVYVYKDLSREAKPIGKISEGRKVSYDQLWQRPGPGPNEGESWVHIIKVSK